MALEDGNSWWYWRIVVVVLGGVNTLWFRRYKRLVVVGDVNTWWDL